MSDIGPGVWLQCIKPVTVLKVGGTYMCNALYPANSQCDLCLQYPPAAISLLGITPSLDHLGWCNCVFKPFNGPEQEAMKISEKIPENAL